MAATATSTNLKMIYYPLTADPSGYKYPQPDDAWGVDISDLGDDKEVYRYSFIIKNHRDADDYSRLIPFGKSVQPAERSDCSTPGPGN